MERPEKLIRKSGQNPDFLCLIIFDKITLILYIKTSMFNSQFILMPKEGYMLEIWKVACEERKWFFVGLGVGLMMINAILTMFNVGFMVFNFTVLRILFS